MLINFPCLCIDSSTCTPWILCNHHLHLYQHKKLRKRVKFSRAFLTSIWKIDCANEFSFRVQLVLLLFQRITGSVLPWRTLSNYLVKFSRTNYLLIKSYLKTKKIANWPINDTDRNLSRVNYYCLNKVHTPQHLKSFATDGVESFKSEDSFDNLTANCSNLW
jgi:hypothetical protein